MATAEQNTTNEVSRKKPQPEEYAAMGVAGGVAVLLLGGLAYYGIAVYPDQSKVYELRDKQAAAIDAQAPALIAADGFPNSLVKADSNHGPVDKMTAVSLNLGSCTLNNVAITVNRNPDNINLTDVTNYSFTAMLDPEVVRYSTGAKYRTYHTYIRSDNDASFNFSDMSELQDILGDNPCATIARGIPDQDPRTPQYDY